MASSSVPVPKARSRTGCITCRARRVKCDERKPTCHRCEAAGRKCDGYGDTFDSGGSEGALTSNSLRIVQHIPGISRPTRMWQTPQSPDLISDTEYRSLEFFQQHTTQSFTADIGALLLRAVYHQSILRSIAVAIGSLHLSFALSERDPLANSSDAEFTLLYYNRAIRELLSMKPETTQPDETFLIACIFFFCFECLRGDYKNAVRHATSGLKILKQQQALPGTNSILPPETIPLVFSVLESQVLETKGEEALDVELRPAMLSSFSHPAINPPYPTSDANEMMKTLQLLHNRFTRFEAACGALQGNSRGAQVQIQHIEGEYSRIRGDLQHWLQVFEIWLDASCQNQEDPAVITMKIWRLLMRVFLDLDWPPSELSWDKYAPVFATINSLAADVPGLSWRDDTSPGIDSGPPLQQSSSRPPTPTFSLSLGIVTPLYMCATRCRFSSIRHHAIDLLLHSRRREGVWDGELAGRVAKRIVTIEESAAGINPGFEYSPEDIDLSARVMSLSPHYTQEKQAKIGYGLMEEGFMW